MAYPIKVCSICAEEFELKPDKPGFANRCPSCSVESSDDSGSMSSSSGRRGSDSELNAARKEAMRNLLYRKDS